MVVLSSRLHKLCRLAALIVGLPSAAHAQVVTTEAELRSAILAAVSGTTITFGANISLTADLPALSTDGLTIDGGGFTLSGGGLYRGFTVAAFFGGRPASV